MIYKKKNVGGFSLPGCVLLWATQKDAYGKALSALLLMRIDNLPIHRPGLTNLVKGNGLNGLLLLVNSNIAEWKQYVREVKTDYSKFHL